MSNLMFVVDVFVSCFHQIPTAIVAGLATFAALWCRKQSYENQTAWTIGLVVVLCLWAIFPQGYHLISPPDVEHHLGGGLAPQAPNYSAMLVADVIMTIVGWVIAKIVWDRNN
ncbi:hypothetical protein [Pseudomonas sp. A34-9]|uniref:hypothetical protein n=1 Tax=Pseudomonas sp. A34-9 TaxID=3034675 RepID=UPI00240E08D0|nr:hypothetical protein [Pseudomonas sp. A34-9]